ncbi:hypothetical protein BU16DRAFT_562430 [Lophium mytilinum]|uniref:Uncharacterized protein n=1 Tax=Lophium mytilinum TaxID=390894 RepID=A0A6A6QRJ3_9PEZI|nr:hypothetical protein BU16DRAFT_562430 [Lophium mytilinum]
MPFTRSAIPTLSKALPSMGAKPMARPARQAPLRQETRERLMERAAARNSRARPWAQRPVNTCPPPPPSRIIPAVKTLLAEKQAQAGNRAKFLPPRAPKTVEQVPLTVKTVAVRPPRAIMRTTQVSTTPNRAPAPASPIVTLSPRYSLGAYCAALQRERDSRPIFSGPEWDNIGRRSIGRGPSSFSEFSDALRRLGADLERLERREEPEIVEESTFVCVGDAPADSRELSSRGSIAQEQEQEADSVSESTSPYHRRDSSPFVVDVEEQSRRESSPFIVAVEEEHDAETEDSVWEDDPLCDCSLISYSKHVVDIPEDSVWEDDSLCDGSIISYSIRVVEIPEDTVTKFTVPTRPVNPAKPCPRNLAMSRSLEWRKGILKAAVTSSANSLPQGRVRWADEVSQPLCQVREFDFTEDDRQQRMVRMEHLYGTLVSWRRIDNDDFERRLFSCPETAGFVTCGRFDDDDVLRVEYYPSRGFLHRYAQVQLYYRNNRLAYGDWQEYYGNKSRTTTLFGVGRSPDEMFTHNIGKSGKRQITHKQKQYYAAS